MECSIVGQYEAAFNYAEDDTPNEDECALQCALGCKKPCESFHLDGKECKFMIFSEPIKQKPQPFVLLTGDADPIKVHRNAGKYFLTKIPHSTRLLK